MIGNLWSTLLHFLFVIWKSRYGDVPPEEVKSATLKKKLEAERKQREHLLALNQIIAKEVMERSKAVAGE